MSREMPDRFALIEREVARSDFAADVRRGLNAPRKFLLPIYFYDALGSALFDAICELPEYYVTRAETSVLTKFAREIVSAFGAPFRIVELGSGSAKKTRILFDAICNAALPGGAFIAGEGAGATFEYVPVDVDRTMLEKTGRALVQEYDRISVNAILSDFRAGWSAGALAGDVRNIVLFLGSTIGNLDIDEAIAMLANLRTALKPGDALLLGADLRKPKPILEAAYDDPLGVTAVFNLNLLQRINRELGGNFNLSQFAHLAFFDEEIGRIEMHLVSRGAQTVRIGDYEVRFDPGETIHTENSYKYDDATLDRIARQSGFLVERKWTDDRGWFADVLLRMQS
jgi:L-histidine Nalpha-methyltransferase